MKGILTFPALVLLTLFLVRCTALRSAKGLSGGRLNVAYTAPLAGSVRYGITDNIESRFSLIFESYNFDLFIHTHSDSTLYNYGVTVGGHYINDSKPSYYAGFTLDRKINNRLLPYVSYMIYSDFAAMQWTLSVGSEIAIPLKKDVITWLIIPELSYSSKVIQIENFRSHYLAALNMGVTFNVKKLFQ